MNVTLQPHMLEPVADFGAAESSLVQVLEGSLPVFVLDAAGVTRSYIVERFRPIIESHDFAFRDADEQITTGTSGLMLADGEPKRRIVPVSTMDAYPHADLQANLAGPIVSVVNMHLTERGSAQGDWYQMNPSYAAKQEHHMPYGVPVGIRQGLVDPEIVMPDYHTAELRAGYLAVFRTGGHSPLIHNFRTLESPRNSYVLRAIHNQAREWVDLRLTNAA